MSIVFNRALLVKYFSIAAKIAAVKSPREILTFVRMESKEGVITLTATDLEKSIRIKVEGAEPTSDGLVLLPASKMMDILRSVDGDMITFDIAESSVEISSNGSKFTMATINPLTYPNPQAVETGSSVTVDSVILCKAIGRIIGVAVGEVSDRYALDSVNIDYDKNTNEFHVVGTDGRSMGICQLPVIEFDGDGLPVTSIIQAKSAMAIVNACSLGGNAKISSNGNSVSIVTDGVEFVCRLVEGRYPTWRKLIPTREADSTLTIDSSKLCNRVKQALISSEVESNTIDFSAGNNVVTFCSASASFGKSSIETTATTTGEGFSFFINGQMVHDFARVSEGDSIIEYRGNNASVIMKSEQLLYIAQPMAKDR
jgi:DNA polymerase-3 subunit beta